MKKLLCVLMFGLMFGQDAITTKEITIPIDENTEMIDIGNYVDLESGLYTVQLIYINEINKECVSNTNCEGIHFHSEIGVGDYYFDYMNGNIHIEVGTACISYENSNLILGHWCGSCDFDFDVVFRVSGRFDDTDVGLNGDMNDDGELDVLDVVSLVQEILSGGMGDVGNLINIVRG